MFVWGKCDGTEDKCQEKKQRFKDSIDSLKKAAAALPEGSDERKRIEKVISKLGDEGKGNIKINFGDAGKTDGKPNLGLTVGNNITINYDAVDQVKSEYKLNQSESSALDAGVTGHEGTHAGGGWWLFGFVGMHGEHAAFWNESITYQGLHNTDRVFQLWNQSWATLDEKLLNDTRKQAVEHNIDPKKVDAPIPHEKGTTP
jgi:hypothetical protein